MPRAQLVEDRTPGWQYFAASTREHFERTALLNHLDRPSRALLRSQSGPGASLSTLTAPICRECTLQPEQFQGVLRRRLQWPLPLLPSVCEGCGAPVDKLGHHLTACMPSGRVRARAGSVETTVAQICREAGGRVRTNVLLKDLNASVAASDERRLEVVASGLSAFGGAQLASDVTVRSVLRRDGSQRPCADWKDGVTAESA